LPYLARGSDALLRKAADLDLRAARSGSADGKAADAWWDYAQTAPAHERWAVQARGRYWYARSIPGLSGANKAEAEKRLNLSFNMKEYSPGMVCEFAARHPAVLKGMKARIEPTIDFSASEFADSSKSTDLTVKWTGAIVAPLPGRYALSITDAGPARVRLDNKVVLDTTLKGTRKEAKVMIGERPTPLVVEFFAQNTDRYTIKLFWSGPGISGETVIPAECLYHDKRSETVLSK
jgi:hypothetical protein